VVIYPNVLSYCRQTCEDDVNTGVAQRGRLATDSSI
jgi:hypothetical protein